MSGPILCDSPAVQFYSDPTADPTLDKTGPGVTSTAVSSSPPTLSAFPPTPWSSSFVSPLPSHPVPPRKRVPAENSRKKPFAGFDRLPIDTYTQCDGYWVQNEQTMSVVQLWVFRVSLPGYFPPDVLAKVVHSFGDRIVLTKDEVHILASKAVLLKVSHVVERVTLVVRRSSRRRNDLFTCRVFYMTSPRGFLSGRCCVHWSFNGVMSMSRAILKYF